ncbi:MAG: bifunctional folylpolyglutamate synthase/dihydrofolate synthase [Dehalogenimonas sp.]
MKSTEYQAALDWLYGFVDFELVPRSRNAARFDLRRVVMLLDMLGNPHLHARTVHIAGSKGKGSTAAMISAVLRQAGFKTGLYTSPHLVEVTERFNINGVDITIAEFIGLVELLKPPVIAINAEARFGKLTTFEIMTALAFMFFAGKGAEWQVIETGLGGRLDATNVVLPVLSVITSISLEHTEVLGSTLAEIAWEKAGIIKPGVPVVCAPQVPEAMEVIAAAAADRNSPLTKVNLDLVASSEYTAGRQSFRLRGFLDVYDVSLPLLGSYQRINAATAVAALEVLEEQGIALNKKDIECGMAVVNWPGRFQVVGRCPWLILDGAHSPTAAEGLKQSLAAFFSKRPCPAVLVVGVSSDKDIAGMAEILTPEFDTIIIVRADHPRSMELCRLSDAFENRGRVIHKAETVGEAIQVARSLAGADGLVCVTGSLFVVGDAMRMLKTVDED